MELIEINTKLVQNRSGLVRNWYEIDIVEDPPPPRKKSIFVSKSKLRFGDRMIVRLLLFQKHYGVFLKIPFLTENFCHFCNGLT